MKIADITRYLEEIAPASLQESYDNAGLITGSPDQEVSGILLCLDSTEEVVEEAIRKNCNLIIAHHPIVFGGLKKLNGKNYVERTVIKAIRNEIAIYAIHTNLDNVYSQGVNGKMAEKLGLVNTQILQPLRDRLCKLVTFVPETHAVSVRDAIFSAGAGHIGNYDSCSFNLAGTGTFRGNDASQPFAGKAGEFHEEKEVRIETVFPAHLEGKVMQALHSAHPYEEIAYDLYPLKNEWKQAGAGMVGELPAAVSPAEFLSLVKETFRAPVIRYTALKEDKLIKRVALCGGSGSFLLGDARRAGAQAFVSSDFKYHQFFDAEGEILIADVGHYEGEYFTIELLAEVLTKKFHTFAVIFSEIITNPIKYHC